MGEGQDALNRCAAVGLVLGLTLSACVGGETAGPPPSGRSKPPAVSPSISIFPVPSAHPSSPRSSPASAIIDAAGIPCGRETHGTVQGVSVTTSYSCFEVSGTTLDELRADAARQGPRAEGQRAVAATRWRIRWDYGFSQGDTTCEVANADVGVVAIYEFPTWTPPPGTNEATVADWRVFMSEVRQHEADHRRIAIEGAVEALATLLDTPAAPTCEQVSDEVDARVEGVVARYRATQRTFDASAAG